MMVQGPAFYTPRARLNKTVQTKVWKRFIDDIFIVWTGTIEEFQDFMDTVNQTHPTKFTHEVSKKQLTFLDVTVFKGDRFETDNKLDIKTHVKNQQIICTRNLLPP